MCILEPGKEPQYEVLPIGWNSKITANNIRELLSSKLGKKVLAMSDGRYAGALGATLLAMEKDTQ